MYREYTEDILRCTGNILGYPDRPGLIVTRNLLKSSGLSKCTLHVSEEEHQT